MDISDTFLKTFQCELYYITPVANIMPQCISEIKKNLKTSVEVATIWGATSRVIKFTDHPGLSDTGKIHVHVD